MGLALDTVLGHVTNSAAIAAVTFASGDSGAVRNYPQTARAGLEAVVRKGATAGKVRVRSPLLCDNVRGIEFTTSESPATYLIPAGAEQMLHPQDVLTVEADSGATDSTAVALLNYYADLPGAAARLHSWGDISGIIANLKPIEVDVAASATIGAWSDTVITTTEDLMKANTDYAVLGLVSNAALCVAGILGPDTGNLRCGVPGATSTLDTSDYFVQMAEKFGTPHIPVINAANKNATYVSVGDNAASTAAKITLICAELAQNLSS